MRLLTDLRRDVALGIRLLVRYPGFSAASIATLAVAIGGNTAVFTIVNALLLTPPPVVEPTRLARVDTGQSLTSWPTYEDIRDGSNVFAGVAAYRFTSMPLEMQATTTARLRGQITSSNYLTVLGVPAERGRRYLADEVTFDRLVLAHHIWRQYFGSDPAIVGRTIVMGGRSFQVAGVMPQGFRGLAPPGVRLDFWLPVNPLSDTANLRNRLVSQFEIVGRLKPGIEHAAATAALRPLAQRLRVEHAELPESFLMIEAGSIHGVNQFRGMASLLLPVFAFLALLMVVSGFVLVIGCSNIAGLLVGRAAMRQREIAVRLSLGSSQGRLLRQLLTESLVLAFAGGAAGLLVAVGLVDVARIGVARLPAPLDLDFALDRRVLVYALGLSTATSVFFGLLPARSALRVDLVSSLKTDSSGSPERQRLRRLMVTAQVAVCSALVVWSVLFTRSLGNVHAVDPGFDATGVVLATVELDRGAIDAERGDRILTEWTQRSGASGGVQSAALANVVPLALTGREEFDVSLPGDADRTRRRVVANRVTPGWFATVRIPIVAGRDFAWNDRKGSPAVAMVNETLARQFWKGEALGQRLLFGGRSLEIVGIASDSKSSDARRGHASTGVSAASPGIHALRDPVRPGVRSPRDGCRDDERAAAAATRRGSQRGVDGRRRRRGGAARANRRDGDRCVRRHRRGARSVWRLRSGVLHRDSTHARNRHSARDWRHARRHCAARRAPSCPPHRPRPRDRRDHWRTRCHTAEGVPDGAWSQPTQSHCSRQ